MSATTALVTTSPDPSGSTPRTRVLPVPAALSLPVVGDPSLRADGGAVASTITVADLERDVRTSTVEVRLLRSRTPAAAAAVGGSDVERSEPVWRSGGTDDRMPRFAPVGTRLAHLRAAEGRTTIRVLDLGRDLGRDLGSDLGRDLGVGPGTDAATDPATPATTEVLASWPTSIRRFAWDPTGTRVAALAVRHWDREASEPITVTTDSYKRDGEGLEPDLFDLLLVDATDGTCHRIAGPFTAAGDLGWSADGTEVLLCLPYDGRRWRWDVVAIPVAQEAGRAAPRTLTAHGDWDRASCPIGLPDGSVLYVGGRAGPGHAHVSLATAGGHGEVRHFTVTLDRNVTIGAPAYPGAPVRIDGDRVLFTANDDGCARLYAVALHGDAAPADPVPLTPSGEVITGMDARAGTVVVTVATATSPGELRVLDADGGHHLVAAPAGVVELPWTVEPFRCRAADGAEVPGWLLRSRAAGPGPAPLLLDVHGGPHNASNGALTTANLHRALLADDGWHVLLVNPRGSDGSGEAWYRGLEPSGGWASADTGDLLAAVDAAVERGIADPDRLAVTGYSYGGLMTALLTTRTDRFRAAALGGSLVDLRSFVVSSDLGPILAGLEVGGTPWSDGSGDVADRRSPIRAVGNVTTPTLVFHGTADQRSPVTQAEQWYQSLRALRVPCELVLYPGAPHGFVTGGRPSWVADAGRRVAAWILHHTP